jgi:hypothetical protein
VKPEKGRTPSRDEALTGRVLEVLVEGIIVVDSRKTISYINHAGRRILRCSRPDDPAPAFGDLVRSLGFDPVRVPFEAPSHHGLLDARSDEEVRPDIAHRRLPSLPYWEQEATIFGVPYLVQGISLDAGGSEAAGMVLRLM